MYEPRCSATPVGDRARRFAGCLAVAVAVAVLGAACGSSKSASTSPSTSGHAAQQPKSGGSLVVGVPTETSGWNPSVNEWEDTGVLVGSTVLEPLATPGADSSAKPWLATSWIANTDFTRWVVHLRTGVTFQDGTPLDAQAAVGVFHAWQVSPFFTTTFGPMFKGAKALDSTTVEYDLTQPWAAFPSAYLDNSTTDMMAPAMLKSPDKGSSHPIGTGPFVFNSWQQNNNFSVTRNPHYWGGLDASGHVMHGTPYLNSIQFRVITDDQTRASALQNGDINMLTTTDAQSAESLAGSYEEVKDWDAGSIFVQLNTAATVNGQPNPLANIHARKALAYATDPQAVAHLAGKGLQLATSPFGPNTPWGLPSDQNGYVDHDVNKAKAEVAEYEKETGAPSLTFSLSGVASLDAQRAMQVLVEQWKQAGIDASIQTVGETARIANVVFGKYQAAYLNNYGFPDPDNQYYFWGSSGIAPPGSLSINFSRYSTPAIDKDLNTGRQSGYPDIRRNAYHDLAKQLNAGFTHVWLYYTPYTYVADKTVQGLNTPTGPGTIPFGNFMPKNWWGQVWLS
jgi:peptide/nickel transport system substrate-binding protein